MRVNSVVLARYQRRLALLCWLWLGAWAPAWADEGEAEATVRAEFLSKFKQLVPVSQYLLRSEIEQGRGCPARGVVEALDGTADSFIISAEQAQARRANLEETFYQEFRKIAAAKPARASLIAYCAEFAPESATGTMAFVIETRSGMAVVSLRPFRIVESRVVFNLLDSRVTPVPARLFVALGAAHPADFGAESVRIREQGEQIDLSVPASRLRLQFAKGGFVRDSLPKGGGAASPRYFRFDDSGRRLILSGWFEAESRFPGAAKFEQNTLVSLKQVGLQPLAPMQTSRVGDWQVLSYDLQAGSVTVTNLRANLIRAGTWIELHISYAAGEGKANLEAAKAFLASVAVSEAP